MADRPTRHNTRVARAWFAFGLIGLAFLGSGCNRNREIQAVYDRLRASAQAEDSAGNWKQADRDLRECVRVTQESQNSSLAASASAARFSILRKQRRFDEAAQALSQAREYAKAANSSTLEPFLLHDQGLLLADARRFEEALTPVRQSLKLFQQAKDKRNAAQVRITLAWALWEMGQYEQASEQNEAFLKEADPSEQHLGLGNLGNLAYQQRDYQRAVAYYEKAALQAKKTNKEYYARWLANEATAWIDLGDTSKAATCNGLALHARDVVPNQSERERLLVNQARIDAKMGQTASAIRQLLEVSRAARNAEATLDAYSELSRIYQDSGNAALARQAYQSGLAVANRERNQISDLENQLSFSAVVMNLNQQYVGGLMKHNLKKEAFETVEASRANTLRAGLNLAPVEESGPVLGAYGESARRNGTAYLMYWLAPEQSYLWVVTGKAFQCYPMPDERELRVRIDRFQKLVQGRKDSTQEGSELFETLVAPAHKQLANIATVVIVPDGALYSMNFETLRQGGRYWIEDVTISVAPSLGLMLGKSGTQPVNRRMLLLGDAVEWNLDFPTLVQSLKELDQIGAKFPQAERTRLTQTQATPAEYERQDLGSYRYIHFATHAAANRNAPLSSAIILSQAKGRGTLTARDVLAKPVSAELISISACRSAGSRTYAGEGLVGLAWAFLYSGAHSVMAGLWEVSDFSSPLIMGGMYGGLAAGEDAPVALRAAKLEMLKSGSKYADPYYWGPFLLYRGAGAK